MAKTIIHKTFAPLKRVLPEWASGFIRRVATAFIGPVFFAYKTGYFRSALKMAAVSKNGKPIPWYTYPSIDFLKVRNFTGKAILEFGGGQSSLWWAERAQNVVTLEGDKSWYEKIATQMPDNVDLDHVTMDNMEANVSAVRQALLDRGIEQYDVIIIDGLYRYQMIEIALQYLSSDGIVICDNAESYGFQQGFENAGLLRVDFFGHAPGVMLPHATSIYFNPQSQFIFSPEYPIPVIAEEA